MTEPTQVVYIVDDDIRVRAVLSDLFSSQHFHCVAFASAADYVERDKPDVPSCLIVDFSLPDIDRLELHNWMAQALHPPIVFTSGRRDIRSCVRAMKAGAVDFLTKPFHDADLLLGDLQCLEAELAVAVKIRNIQFCGVIGIRFNF